MMNFMVRRAGHVACVGENLRGRDNLKGIEIDGRIILIWILNREWEDVEWIRLAQSRDKRQNFVHTE
jgi:hypothetical protein